MSISNNRYDEIKKEIYRSEIKIVSFDIFDTLLVRPFLRPTDLFIMLDDDFRNFLGGKTAVKFSFLRVECEKKAREILSEKTPELEDITLDEIYDALCFIYGIPVEIAEQMKILEIELELRFNAARKSVFELYEIALHIGKKVICISDMYLPKDVIKKILIKNGYAAINKIYVSSETRMTKCGNMYSFVISELKITPCEILHLGDNYEADFKKAKEVGLNAIYYQKTQEAFFDPSISGNLGQIFTRQLPFWQANSEAINFFGIRVMLSLIANRYFDNPHRTFNQNTDFNTDPELIGYAALGTYLFGVITWLIDKLKKKCYDKILFVARDGYLPMEAYKILKPFYDNLPSEDYLYMSRQAILLLSIQDNYDIYKLHEIIGWENKSPIDVLPYLRILFDINEDKLKILCKKKKINLKAKFIDIGHYYKFTILCRDNFFNYEMHFKKLDKLREYFCKKLEGNVCIFDIGYSARPELYLSRLCKKPIDTYFINTHEEGLMHAHEGKFELITFLDYKPAIYGFIDEVFFSKMEGSCKGYNFEGEKVAPIIGEYNPSYAERFIIETIQKTALNFMQDITHIFKTDVQKLWHQRYYTSLLFWLFYFSSKETDRNLFNCFHFEDDIAYQTGSLVDRWNQAIIQINQHPIEELYSLQTSNILPSGFANRSKIIKMFYYIFFDRQLLKIKTQEGLKNNRITLRVLKFLYKTLRRVKSKMVKI